MSALLTREWAEAVVEAESTLPARGDLPRFCLRRVVWDSCDRRGVVGWSDEVFEQGRVVSVEQTQLGSVDLTLHGDTELWKRIDGTAPLSSLDWEHFEAGADPAARVSVASAVGLSKSEPMKIVDLRVDLDIGFVLDGGVPGGALQFVDVIRDGWLARRDVAREATVDLSYRVSGAAMSEYLAGEASLRDVMPQAVYEGPPTGLVTLLGWLQEARFVSSFGFAGAAGVRWWLAFTLLGDPRRIALRRALHGHFSRPSDGGDEPMARSE